jgi:molecular chaperone GrpE (heat shock protein)
MWNRRLGIAACDTEQKEKTENSLKKKIHMGWFNYNYQNEDSKPEPQSIPTPEPEQPQLEDSQIEQPQQEDSQQESQAEQTEQPEPQPVQEQSGQIELIRAFQRTIQQFTEKLDNIQRSNEQRLQQLEEKLEEKEDIIRQQHNQLLKFQDDVIFKTQQGIIMEVIGIADNLRTILKKQQEQKDYDDMLDDLQQLQRWIDSTLEENGVRKFEEAATLPFNPKRQAITDTQPAPEPELSGTYVTEQPGYEWSVPYVVIRSDVQLQNFMADNKMPKKFSYVIRQEEVIKLK